MLLGLSDRGVAAPSRRRQEGFLRPAEPGAAPRRAVRSRPARAGWRGGEAVARVPAKLAGRSSGRVRAPQTHLLGVRGRLARSSARGAARVGWERKVAGAGVSVQADEALGGRQGPGLHTAILNISTAGECFFESRTWTSQHLTLGSRFPDCLAYSSSGFLQQCVIKIDCRRC